MKKIFLSEQKLYELMDNPVPYTVRTKNKNSFIVEFEIEGLEYIFRAFKDVDDIEFEIIFELIKKSGKSSFEIENTGHQFTVFATIGDILEYFIQDYNPDAFSFSAKERSREKLYRVFAKKIVKKFDYEFEEQYNGDVHRFNFSKKEKEKEKDIFPILYDVIEDLKKESEEICMVVEHMFPIKTPFSSSVETRIHTKKDLESSINAFEKWWNHFLYHDSKLMKLKSFPNLYDNEDFINSLESYFKTYYYIFYLMEKTLPDLRISYPNFSHTMKGIIESPIKKYLIRFIPDIDFLFRIIDSIWTK